MNDAPLIKRLGWYLPYLIFRVLSWLINLLPAAVADSVAFGVGNIMYLIMPTRRKVALDNLELAFGDSLSPAEKRKIARNAFQHISIAFMELFRVPKTIKMGVENVFTIKGLEHFEKAFERKKGIIFAISHIGSWEYLSFLFYLTGYQCFALVKKLRNPYIYHWLQDMRRQATLNVIHKDNPRKSLKRMMEELANNNIIALLLDQWAGNDELWIDFFGHPASTTSIPARLAMKTGCALVMGACLRKAPGKYEITLFPEIEIDKEKDTPLSIAQDLNKRLEEQIRQNPGQWIWTHKRWKPKKIYN